MEQSQVEQQNMEQTHVEQQNMEQTTKTRKDRYKRTPVVRDQTVVHARKQATIHRFAPEHFHRNVRQARIEGILRNMESAPSAIKHLDCLGIIVAVQSHAHHQVGGDGGRQMIRILMSWRCHERKVYCENQFLKTTRRSIIVCCE